MKITKQESYTIELSRAELALIYVTIGASSHTSRAEAFAEYYGSAPVSKKEFDEVNNSNIYDQLDELFKGK